MGRGPHRGCRPPAHGRGPPPDGGAPRGPTQGGRLRGRLAVERGDQRAESPGDERLVQRERRHDRLAQGGLRGRPDRRARTAREPRELRLPDHVARPHPGRQGHRREEDARGARSRDGPEGSHLPRADPGHGRRRGKVQAERVLRAPGAPVGPRHVRGARSAEAPDHQGGGRGPEPGGGRDRHRAGRSARHRQEPRGDDAGGRGTSRS